MFIRTLPLLIVGGCGIWIPSSTHDGRKMDLSEADADTDADTDADADTDTDADTDADTDSDTDTDTEPSVDLEIQAFDPSEGLLWCGSDAQSPGVVQLGVNADYAGQNVTVLIYPDNDATAGNPETVSTGNVVIANTVVFQTNVSTGPFSDPFDSCASTGNPFCPVNVSINVAAMNGESDLATDTWAVIPEYALEPTAQMSDNGSLVDIDLAVRSDGAGPDPSIYPALQIGFDDSLVELGLSTADDFELQACPPSAVVGSPDCIDLTETPLSSGPDDVTWTVPTLELGDASCATLPQTEYAIWLVDLGRECPFDPVLVVPARTWTNEDCDNDGVTFGNNDCDDLDTSFNPNQPDPCGSGVDEDCDGVDGTGSSSVAIDSVIYSDLEAALDAAVDGDTIQVCGDHTGIAADIDIATGENLTIQGQGAMSTTLTGTGSNSVVAVSSTPGPMSATLTLSDVTITGGSGMNGGGVVAQDASIALTNVVLTGNAANNKGGGLFIRGGGGTLNNVEITDNSATLGGGAAFEVGTDGDVTLASSSISGNTATDCGGGLLIQRARVVGTDTTIGANTALEGTAVCMVQDGMIPPPPTGTLPSPALTDAAITDIDNGASAIAMRDLEAAAVPELQAVTISGTSQADSISITGDGATVSLNGVMVEDGTSSRALVVDLPNGTVNVSGSSFTGNMGPMPPDFGAGVAVLDGTVVLTGSTITGNMGPDGVGGYIAGGTLQVGTGTIVDMNQAMGTNIAFRVEDMGVLDVCSDMMVTVNGDLTPSNEPVTGCGMGTASGFTAGVCTCP